jgi:hypothetical protein
MKSNSTPRQWQQERSGSVARSKLGVELIDLAGWAQIPSLRFRGAK